MLSDSDLESLISCRKTIVSKPRREPKDYGSHLRNDMMLMSEDQQYSFSVFMRISKEFPENFSIGLSVLNAVDGAERITLVRYNGIHGGHIEFPHHVAPHIHTITADRIADGVYSEGHAETTDTYTTYQDALAAFCRRCNIVDAEKIFPFIAHSKEIDIFQN